jgi:hypothetical protein
VGAFLKSHILEFEKVYVGQGLFEAHCARARLREYHPPERAGALVPKCLRYFNDSALRCSHMEVCRCLLPGYRRRADLVHTDNSNFSVTSSNFRRTFEFNPSQTYHCNSPGQYLSTRP